MREENRYFLRRGFHKVSRTPNIPESSCQRQAKSQISQDEEEYSASNPGRRKTVDIFRVKILHEDQISSDEILVNIKS